jgi:hypothetical protein
MNHWPKDRAETFDRDLSLIAWILSFLEGSEQASTIDRLRLINDKHLGLLVVTTVFERKM